MGSSFLKPGFSFKAALGTNSTGITITPNEEHMKSDRIQFTDLSDEEILNFINGKYSPGGSTDFAVGDLFKITKTIIVDATRDSMVNDILKSANALDEKVPSINVDNFISPLCILKSICCEMSSCKDKACSGEEISIKTRTELIFDKLKPYPWEAKAVLALAAFALEYGDLWHLAQLYGQCNQLTNSVAILKRVPVLIKNETLEERKGEVVELNRLINNTLEVTDFICTVEDLYIHNRTEDVPTLDTAVKDIPTHVFWIITTIVACAVKVTHLTGDEKKPYPLSYLVEKIAGILKTLKTQHATCLKERELAKNYKKLCRKMFNAQSTLKITEVINSLILFKDDGKLPAISVDCSVKEVNSEIFADVIKEKSVLFYMTSLENITIYDVNFLTNVYNEYKKNNENWTMVWIPIVEDWNENQIEKFEHWGSKMPWYKVQFFSSTVIKYLKEAEWSYEGNAKCVVMNPQGQLQYHNVLTLIRKYGVKWLDHIHPGENMPNELLEKWSNDETKCIFLFEGKDEWWINEMKKKVKEVNGTIIKEFGVSINLFRVVENKEKVGEEPKYLVPHESFWSVIQNCSFYLVNRYNQLKDKTETNKLLKLLSYQKHGDPELVMVSQGEKLIATSGRPATILKVLENMSQWKAPNSLDKISAFGSHFQENLKRVETDYEKSPDCCEFDIPGKIPKNIGCPVCDHPLETTIFVSYKCCHRKNSDN
ncbi:protein SIEVE ELEMENT OCCLUSION B [Rosa sericea]